MVKYEKRILCFIDILGFSSIIKNTTRGDDKAQTELDNMCNALDILRNYCDKLNDNEISTTQFSDSIVLSFPWKKDDWQLVAVFKSIKMIQVVLLYQFNLLLRGGIVIGDILHTDKILIGPAMIDAYALESKCANSPRIVLDPKVVTEFNRFKKKAKQYGYDDNNVIIHKDFDDTSYIDYFNLGESEILDLIDVKKYFEVVCRQIATNVNSSDMSIRVKYLWMRNKLKSSSLFKLSEYKDIYRRVVTNKGKIKS